LADLRGQSGRRPHHGFRERHATPTPQAAKGIIKCHPHPQAAKGIIKARWIMESVETVDNK